MINEATNNEMIHMIYLTFTKRLKLNVWPLQSGTEMGLA